VTTACKGNYEDVAGDCREPNQCDGEGTCSDSALFVSAGTSCSVQVTVPTGGEAQCHYPTAGKCIGNENTCIVSLPWLHMIAAVSARVVSWQISAATRKHRVVLHRNSNFSRCAFACNRHTSGEPASRLHFLQW
jgi:hypothetical protein